MTGFSCRIRFACLALLLALIKPRHFSRNALVFFRDGFMSNLPEYLRTSHPRKSKPRLMFVTCVFSTDKLKPRTARNLSINGLTSFSSNSGEVPVITKSSARSEERRVGKRVKPGGGRSVKRKEQ